MAHGTLMRIAAAGVMMWSGTALVSAAFSPKHFADPATNLLPTRRRASKGRGLKRGKGRQAKPPKRCNLRTVSKRVRRKHRRAA
jgi:hypothetical protein